MIIDSHAHFIPPRLLEAIQDSAGDFPALELFPDGKGSFGFAFAGNKPTRPASKMLSDTKGRLDWMDSHGIDLQVIGGWLDMFGYEMPADQGRQWACMINQHLKEFCLQNDRFGLSSMALQSAGVVFTSLYFPRGMGHGILMKMKLQMV